MSSILSYARDLLVCLGLIRTNTVTPLASLFSDLPGHHRILIGGLDAAGKSTLLRDHLVSHEKDVLFVIPFIGFIVEAYRCNNATFHAIDLGGGRPKTWYRAERSFFRHADAVIWIMDANDHDRYVEAREELLRPIYHEEGLRKDIPVLILANKQDSPNAWNVKQTESFLINHIPSPLANVQHEVFGTNIKTGEGLKEAFKWLSEKVESRIKYDTIVNDKFSVYDTEEEIGMIIMEGIKPVKRDEVNEKDGWVVL